MFLYAFVQFSESYAVIRSVYLSSALKGCIVWLSHYSPPHSPLTQEQDEPAMAQFNVVFVLPSILDTSFLNMVKKKN